MAGRGSQSSPDIGAEFAAVPGQLAGAFSRARRRVAGLHPLAVVAVWAAGTALLVFLGPVGALSPAVPGTCEPVPNATDQWDLWQATPVGWTAACLLVAVSIRWAGWLGPRLVVAVAWLSVPLQVWWWHDVLRLPGWCV